MGLVGSPFQQRPRWQERQGHPLEPSRASWQQIHGPLCDGEAKGKGQETGAGSAWQGGSGQVPAPSSHQGLCSPLSPQGSSSPICSLLMLRLPTLIPATQQGRVPSPEALESDEAGFKL